MIADLIDFLNSSPVNFCAARTISQRLEKSGYVYLDPRKRWEIVPGGKYYTTQNYSAVFAFIAGQPGGAYRIISAHSDSPGFRIKPNCEILTEGRMLKLNTEVYGGPILYTWFDRPLSIAGRVILRSDNPMCPRHETYVHTTPMLTIPHLAIHYNRAVNDGNPLSRQKDMLPVVGRLPLGEEPRGWLTRFVAAGMGVEPDDILDYDLSLFDTTPAELVGPDADSVSRDDMSRDCFLTSGRIDDLSMAYSAVSALLACQPGCPDTRIAAIFDNEETGSGTKQGAASPILDYIMRRVNLALSGSEEDYMAAVARSFMVSADNAHGLHPNYIEKQDPTNHPILGEGPVIKINANCKYMTDADSAAVFASICEAASVPYQYFVNHSDTAGGSTLGNILTSQIPLRGVDMGAAIWAMHSVRETASVRDHHYTIRAFTQFFNL